jgi:hypothetical protein
MPSAAVQRKFRDYFEASECRGFASVGCACRAPVIRALRGPVFMRRATSSWLSDCHAIQAALEASIEVTMKR